MITEQAAFLSPVDMMIVMAVALVVFGPAKLPEVGRQLGQAIRELKKLTSELTESIHNETSDIKSAFDKTSPYTLKPGPVDIEPHQTTGAEGYIKEDSVQLDELSAQDAVGEPLAVDGQAAAAAVPLTPTVHPRTEEEAL